MEDSSGIWDISSQSGNTRGKADENDNDWPDNQSEISALSQSFSQLNGRGGYDRDTDVNN